MTIDDKQIGSFGIAGHKVYDDWDNVGEVTSLPDAASHRDVDKIVLAAEQQYGGAVKTAIVCPPTIYGRGRGPDNQRSVQVPALARCTLTEGHGIMVGEGQAYWTEVNVHDLSKLYLLLVDEAVKGGGRATWGLQGYYFAQSDEFMWGDIAREVAKAAHSKGYIASTECVSYSPSEVDKLSRAASRLWGQNSRSRAIRAKKLLGWKPNAKTLKEDIPEAVEIEALSLGLQKKHAEIAAGNV